MAEKLALLVHAFKDPEQSLLFVEAFLRIEAQEWLLLDCFRLDKFMMVIKFSLYCVISYVYFKKKMITSSEEYSVVFCFEDILN